MARPLVEIRCSSWTNNSEYAFLIVIDSPKIDPASGDYFCSVACESIALRMNVFGVTKQQAIKTALELTELKVGRILCTDLTEAEGEAWLSVAQPHVEISSNTQN